ncbi:MAG: type II toxin-antitoxin system RelE/ParE family toxin [Bacteroidaceae bacterium]|nr:type II toxin-antitoxin system RelE/ParE family toxin [Bacteroidaceae bacterium]
MNILYSSLFLSHLEDILFFYDERNGSDTFSRKLLQKFQRQIGLLATMPDIGRKTNHANIRILFIDDYGIEYERINNDIIIIDIYSCLTNPALRRFIKA